MPPTDIEIALAAERERAQERELSEGRINETPQQRETRHRRQEARAQDLARSGHDETWAHLQQLEREHKRLLRHNVPVTSALWLALMKPGEDIMQRHVSRMRRISNAEAAPVDDPSEQGPSQVPAIILMGETMVAKALMGDTAAFSHIAERIEGKPGVRKGEETPETQAARNVVLGAMREIVTMMVDAKHGRAVDVTEVSFNEGAGDNEVEERDVR